MLERRDWLALGTSSVGGPVVWGTLMRAEMSPPEITAWRNRARAAANEAQIAGIESEAARHDCTLLTPADADWPLRLRMLADPPALLWCRGAVSLLTSPQIAVVGARRASLKALADVDWLVPPLVDAGLTITSGLALGVDGRAHEAALAAGRPTVAILGCGLDRPYPGRHRPLAARIAQDGLLASEFAPGTPPLAHHFPRRNRLISALALGVLVVEAGERSGSMITARLAAEQGREVFAVPSGPRDAGAAGCLRLLREGAVLVRHAQDVLDELLPPPPGGVIAAPTPDAGHGDARIASAHGLGDVRSGPQDHECRVGPEAAPTAAHAHVLSVLESDGSPFDVIRARTGLDAAALAAALTELELEGRVVTAQGRWAPSGVVGGDAGARR